MLRDGTVVAVLEPSAVALYERRTAGWDLSRRELLPVMKPAARDPRARLAVNGAAVTAYIPGMTCVSQEIGTQPFSCQSGESNWPVVPGLAAHWVTNRNYVQTDFGTAYTAASVAPDRIAWTALDGTLRLASTRGEAITAMTGYGSDAAAVESPCGTFVVTTKAGDATDSDQLIPLDVRNSRFEQAGAALPVPGPVTVLWPAEVRTEAHAVVRNANSGAYEISRVAIQCVQ
jgi:hypothetical protein